MLDAHCLYLRDGRYRHDACTRTCFLPLRGNSIGKGNQQEGGNEGIEYVEQQVDWREVEERRGKRARSTQNEQDDIQDRGEEGVVHAARWTHECDIQVRCWKRTRAGEEEITLSGDCPTERGASRAPLSFADLALTHGAGAAGAIEVICIITTRHVPLRLTTTRLCRPLCTPGVVGTVPGGSDV